MTDAMQITVSSEIENRIDDSNSTDARSVREPQLSFMPCVETVMPSIQMVTGGGARRLSQKKDGLSLEKPALVRSDSSASVQ